MCNKPVYYLNTSCRMIYDTQCVRIQHVDGHGMENEHKDD